LQRSQPIFDTAQILIKDAVVLYYENEQLLDTLHYLERTSSYLITPRIIDYPNYGNTYSVLTKKEGYATVSATTLIPSIIKITDTVVTPIAYFDDNKLVYSQVSFSFQDPPNETNYYEVAITDIAFSKENSDLFYELTTSDKLVTMESYYPSLIRFDIKKPKYLLFTDKTINGLKHTLNVYYFPPQIFDGQLKIRDHYISIHLRNVTEDYYNFKTTMLQHLNSKKEDFLYGTGEPINPVSNIKNGYGLFSGYNTDIVSMHIDSKIVR
jgi:hypothetical protein